MKNKGAIAGLVLAVSAVLPMSAMAQGVEKFYKGQNVRIHIGGSLGGGYGAYAQLLSRHIGKHIPGKPTVIVVPLAGAGGTRNLLYMAEAAPKDGSVMSLPSWEVVLFSLFGHPTANINAGNYNWIGRVADVQNVLVASGKAGVKTIDQAKGRRLQAGSQSPQDHFAISPKMVNKVLGTDFRIVTGYDGTSQMYLAMEQGEIDVLTPTWANISVLQKDKLASGQLVPLIAITEQRLPDAPNLPALGEFVKDPAMKTFLTIYLSQGVIGRSVITPKGVPDDRVAALRSAFDATMRDPEFLADIKKLNLELSPLSSSELERRIQSILAAPADQVKAAKAIYQEFIAPGGK